MKILTGISKPLEIFAIDLRSLALLRIGIALVILGDLLVRFTDLKAFYTDAGVMPRTVVIEQTGGGNWSFCLHLASGSYVFQAFLFALQGLFALMLLVGYRSIWANIGCWVLLLSLQNRSPMIQQGGDDVLRLLLFWMMFLPLGACYSVDRALDTTKDVDGTKKEVPYALISMATAALLLQICFIYWFAAALKTGQEWHQERSALYYALNFDQIAKPIGQMLLPYPEVMKFLTAYTLYVETVGPFLALSIFFHGPLRTLAVMVFISFHVGMGICMELGIFSVVASVGWLVFLPTWFWDKLRAYSKRPLTSVTIYYDGECEFCQKMALLIKTFLLLEAPLVPAQNNPSAWANMTEYNSWVIEGSNGQRYFKYDGFVCLCAYSPILRYWRWLFALQWSCAIGNKVYEWIANHRQIAASATGMLKFRPLIVVRPNWQQFAAAYFLLYAFCWNVRTIDFAKYQVIFPTELNFISDLSGAGQMWAMFAPFPAREDGWYVIVGEEADTTQIDLLQGGNSVHWEKPVSVSATYKNDRWRKYFLNLWMSQNARYRPPLTSYLCRQWNSRHLPNVHPAHHKSVLHERKYASRLPNSCR